MTTPEAIQALQAIAATLTDEVKGSQGRLDAVKLATQQLQGLLDTPSADLVTAQEALAVKTQEADTTKTELEHTKAALTAANDRIAVLESQANTPPIP